MMHARETDHVLALSVFAPITDALEQAKLHTKDVDLPEEHVVLTLPIELSPKEAGEPVNFEFRFSSGRSFDCALAHRKTPGISVEIKEENPPINVSNPGAARVGIAEVEEDLRDAGGLADVRDPGLLAAWAWCKSMLGLKTQIPAS